MAYLPESTVLGRIEIVEVYEYYDIPRLFLCQNEFGHFYVALSIGEDLYSNTWLYVLISRKRLELLRSGKIQLRDVYRKAEDRCVFKVLTHVTKPHEVVTLACKDVREEWLPAPGEKLSLSRVTFPPKISQPALPGMEDALVTRLNYIIQAFEETRDGFSLDVLLANPDLNDKFLKRCRDLGLSGSDFSFNWELMNARKANKLSQLSKSKRYTVDAVTIDKFYFGSELTLRFFALAKGITLDQVLCQRELAKEFCEYASRLAPGFSSFDYLWAALRVRKRGRFKNITLPDVDRPELESLENARSLRIPSVPTMAGFYMFSSDDLPIFINQTENLHFRLAQHMDFSSHRGLPEWLWGKSLQVAFTARPELGLTDRQIIELSEIISRHPLFNFYGSVA